MTDEQPDVEEDAPAEEDAEESTGLQMGDFVKVEYTARTVDGDDLVDTTDRETAEEAEVETEGRDFSPRTIVLGEGHLFAPVEDDMVGKEVGDSGSVVVPAQQAFGEYDEDEVRTVSAEKIPEDDRYPGAHVDVDGQHGHVETIIGGRARVDFNHPLAGQDIEYEYEIVETVDDRLDRAQGLLKMYFDVDLDMWIETDEVEEEVEVEVEGEPEEEAAEVDEEAEAEAEPGGEADEDEGEPGVPGDEGDDAAPETRTEIQTVEKETLYIESDPQLQFNQQWMMGKQQILGDVIEKIGVDRVIVQEIIEGGPQMPGMGGLGGLGGGGDLGDIEESLEDADIDADEIVEELGGEEGEDDLDVDELTEE
ncbi:MAG: peptidylprolyl isomerase [Halodesulfurarchaeum sp.]